MKKKILLITGWGVGTAPLQPLKEALEVQNVDVHLIDIFDVYDSVQLEQYKLLAQNVDVLVGWSLGGQIALYLSSVLSTPKPVITLASNPCFVATKQWPCAMPPQVFLQFKENFLADANATLKQFYLNLCKGEERLKASWLSLIKVANPAQDDTLQKGLALLEKLDLVDYLAKSQTPSYHVFAVQDSLVPSQVSHYFEKISSKFIQYETISSVSHAFPFTDVEQTLQTICKFLK